MKLNWLGKRVSHPVGKTMYGAYRGVGLKIMPVGPEFTGLMIKPNGERVKLGYYFSPEDVEFAMISQIDWLRMPEIGLKSII